jgi:hypothetical protein
MALDDFTSDDDEDRFQDKPENWSETIEELKNNEPPSNADSWIEHEPGVPDWLGFIEWEDCEVDESDFDEDDDSNMLYETGEAVRVKVTGVNSTQIVCTNPVDLGRMR